MRTAVLGPIIDTGLLGVSSFAKVGNGKTLPAASSHVENYLAFSLNRDPIHDNEELRDLIIPY
jgi:hypothetical protein